MSALYRPTPPQLRHVTLIPAGCRDARDRPSLFSNLVTLMVILCVMDGVLEVPGAVR
ncbi:hypothetical protein SGR_168 [Streptomyces griseus subsp. griseus NBRC 13350]|uniref:Uncharacterized protein n=1 Tax=Streptomyces griseus subsp. griseus (strain JCM 4626 / CBS 651.72 / NBRC 13350 / KCC S-0626 / ISP 5235) TaxID=455632 RepID=B1VNH4_STRGG|nr:hypothetical protein SGR_168 [Streptomyces griseus subsp. griseus NBRC 13350]